MKRICALGTLIWLGSCSTHNPELSLYPEALMEKNCPIYQKGQTVDIAQITFEEQSLKLDADAQATLVEVAEMAKRCRAFVELTGYQLVSEPKDFGFLRAGVSAKAIEKQGVFASYMKFTQSSQYIKPQVLVVFNFNKKIGDQ